MELVLSSGLGILIAVVAFLIVLSIVVFVHEFGHYYAGRVLGVGADAFSIGFGPEIFGWTDKHGTRWKISLFPLGGYVKFAGDNHVYSAGDNPGHYKEVDGGYLRLKSDQMKEALFGRPVWQRAIIVAAGPFANFVLSIVIFSFLFIAVGKMTSIPRVDQVVLGGAAELAGVQVGDIILSIDGTEIESFGDIQRIVTLNADIELPLVINRNGNELVLAVIPKRVKEVDFLGNVQEFGQLGIASNPNPDDVSRVRYSIPGAVVEGTKETWFIISTTMKFVYGMIVGRESPKMLTGPIGIAEASGKIATFGLSALLFWTALISTSIGLINLFPIPALDGGHLVYCAYEAIRGKPLSPKSQNIGMSIGIALVLMLLVFATWNDISRFIYRGSDGATELSSP